MYKVCSLEIGVCFCQKQSTKYFREDLFLFPRFDRLLFREGAELQSAGRQKRRRRVWACFGRKVWGLWTGMGLVVSSLPSQQATKLVSLSFGSFLAYFLTRQSPSFFPLLSLFCFSEGSFYTRSFSVFQFIWAAQWAGADQPTSQPRGKNEEGELAKVASKPTGGRSDRKAKAKKAVSHSATLPLPLCHYLCEFAKNCPACVFPAHQTPVLLKTPPYKVQLQLQRQPFKRRCKTVRAKVSQGPRQERRGEWVGSPTRQPIKPT